jgi:hypothetical protein
VSVVVNEWEVVPEPEPQASPRTPPPATGDAAQKPSVANEIERVLRRVRERALRVRAD